MKKMLLIVGIILVIAFVLSLLYAALNLYVYYHALDGSAELYSSLHQRILESCGYSACRLRRE